MVERIRKPEGAQEPRAVALGELVHEAVRAAIERAVQEELTEAIAGAYLAGANTRRIRGALRPLLKAAPLSKSAVSRVVATLKDALETSRKRSLTELEVVYLYLDAFALRVRSGGKVVSVPVLGAVAVLADGAKQLLSLELCGSESHEAWKGFLDDLVGRGLRPPLLFIIDGNPGLRRAVELCWPRAAVQRCVVHKLRNLERKAPKHAREEIAEDFHRIVYAESEAAARAAWTAFERKWKGRCPGVVRSLAEGGDELLTCADRISMSSGTRPCHRAEFTGTRGGDSVL